jgi:pyruvate dehydrogenase phosphatase
VLSSNHNGKNTSESERIRSEHPGEEECVLKDRVLGAIAVTRGSSNYDIAGYQTDHTR